MEQLSFFELPYKYIIDTSSILSQKPNEKYNRTVFSGMWKTIYENIKSKTIITCSEIYEEIQEQPYKDWIKSNCQIIEIDEDIQYNVRKIVTEHPQIISFSNNRGSSSGDVFLIATAMKMNLTVITEENSQKPNKIPQICKLYNIEALNIMQLCAKEGWTF